LRVLVSMAPSGLPRLSEIGIDGPVLLFTLGISLLASVLFGSIPIFKYAGVRLSTGIREGSRGLSQSREHHRVRNFLVVVQVSLAFVLLICSGLMIRTFRALTHVNPGFSQPEQLQTFGIALPATQIPDPESVVRLYQEISNRLAAIPGVSSVSLSSAVPMDGNDYTDILYPQDRSYAEGQLPPSRRFKFVAPGSFATIGTPLVAGRDFTWTDIYKRFPAAIISENFARELWNTPENALGKRLRGAATDDWREVVGVVGDVHDDGVSKASPTMVYWPLLMDRFDGEAVVVQRDVVFAVRSPRAGTESFLKEVRQAVWSVNSNLPLASTYTLGYYYTRSMSRTSFTLVMLGAAASMALLLGVVGIYGVIAYSVAQRTREIGIRMALGAYERALITMFVRHGLVLTSVGVAFGFVTAILVMRFLSSILFNVNPVDPMTYGIVAAGLLATAFLASYLPSRRVTAVDPVEALRAE